MNITDLIKTIKANRLDVDLDMIRLAYEFADEAHKGKTRMSGEPYIIHPLHTAVTLAELKLDEESIIAGLLHDVHEDADIPLAEIEKQFGKTITQLVEGVTKLGKLKYRGITRYMESLRKMFVAMAKDIRVILIKFADRIHNLETLEHLPKRKQVRIGLESLEIYAPIANRLGMGEIKGRIEDLSFPYVHPKEYQEVITLVRKYIPSMERTLEVARREIIRVLRKEGLTPVDIHGRKKHLYSLYQKLQRKDGDITKVYDLVALRVIVRDVQECYGVLGTIHQLWVPLKGRIKDFIAQPKPNGYQSLHTTVFGPNGNIIEIQIRTTEMHDLAEYGVAAHWHYDEKKPLAKKVPAKKLSWVRELAEWQQEAGREKDYLKALKIDVFQNRIFVFTPNGDVIELPEDSTPVDFAYAIHTEIGNTATVAKVNEAAAKLDTKLKSGDLVEIVTDKSRKGPSRDWLRFVKTRHAKARIRQFAKR